MIKVSVVIPVWNQESLIERAVHSIPRRDDVEIVAVDDASTDDTLQKLFTLREERNDPNFVILSLPENRGVGYAVNVGLNAVSGEYTVLLGSDDYFMTEEFEKVMQLLDGTDLVYFDLQVNNGDIWHLNKTSKKVFVGAVKFMRTEFVGDTRCPEIRNGEDWFFTQDLMAKDPTETFSGRTVLHYNWPRKGSLTYMANVAKERANGKNGTNRR